MKACVNRALLWVTFVLALMIASIYVLTPLTFDLLFPGNAVSLMITGVHGGTTLEQLEWVIADFLVNSISYFILILLIRKTIFALRKHERP